MTTENAHDDLRNELFLAISGRFHNKSNGGWPGHSTQRLDCNMCSVAADAAFDVTKDLAGYPDGETR